MTVKELESKAWQLIGMAKVATNKTRRKVLMQEAYNLLARASALRQLDLDSEELNGHSSIGERGYRMRLSNWDGTTLLSPNSSRRATARSLARYRSAAIATCAPRSFRPPGLS